MHLLYRKKNFSTPCLYHGGWHVSLRCAQYGAERACLGAGDG